PMPPGHRHRQRPAMPLEGRPHGHLPAADAIRGDRGLPGFAQTPPLCSILPDGQRRGSSGTLLPVMSPILAATLAATLAVGPAPVARSADVAAAAPAPGSLQCAGAAATPPVGERSRLACEGSAAVHRGHGAAAMDRGRPAEAAIGWRGSRAGGKPFQGRLVGGVELPAAGTNFVTVDPVTGDSPNRARRRYGTDRLGEGLLTGGGGHAGAHPAGPPPGLRGR